MHCVKNSTRKVKQGKGYEALCPRVHNLTGVSEVTILDGFDHMGFVEWRNSD